MKKMNSQVWALVIFSLVFAVVYKFSLWYAASLGNVSSFVFSFEKDIPFIPWTIIPYLSSGAFFCIVFLQIRSREALRLFLKRVVAMTLLAGIFFIFLPLQYSYAKPEVKNPVFGALFWLLEGFDDRYNQSPSLHVAFAFAFWTVFRELKNKWRTVAAIWLVMVALSTLTTFQHHLIDIFTGSILAHFVFVLFPSQNRQVGFRNLHVANCYFLIGWATVFTAFLLAEFYAFYWIHLCWLGVAIFVLGYLYQTNRVGYLRLAQIKIRTSNNR
ncbi:phosphatase PAP2 family protein [Kaistella rhinocerotis]|uniref:phosphatase PAP2 family protein n=1 Tax=Kaistella rhinocerotis TaxID=3026437 RepID=UPI002552637F|nr:phosphatase PAP2 family protein [Kaistella sp. Ran72]